NQMAQRLQRLISDQRQLLSDVSHELRSPLARSAVALELARSDAVPEQEEYLDRIELENQRLNELIEDFLNMARLETLDNHTSWQRINLALLLQNIIDDAQFEHPNTPTHYQMPSGPGSMLGDAEVVASAFDNVIRHALLHTRGSVD